jgi:pimeloyl-ACP methyl ester carboxylesterase
MALSSWVLNPFGHIQVEKRWVSVDGHQMHCLQAGAGPDLILLHGLLGTASTWEPMMAGLAEHSSIHAIDALGIGESERVAGIDATLESQADRIVAFMDKSAIAAADFLATSHGGAVALTLATKYPGRVRNLVLHAPANPYSRLGDPLINFYLSGLGTWFAHRVPNLPEPMKALALGRMYGDPTRVRDGSLAKYFGSLRIPGTISYVLSMLKTWNDDMRKLEALLPRLRAFNALLVWGDRDRAVSMESGRYLQQWFDKADMVVLPGTGHLPFEECPEPFTRTVNTFLTQMRSQQETGLRLVPNHV